MKKQKHIHFMGIGGSGMSAVAMLAKNEGYKVSGCDLQESTPYLAKLKKAKIPIYVGHDEKHIKDVDILAVTAATFYQNKNHLEIIAGNKKSLMQWQEFMGKYLQKDKKVICVAGTHGKSTTTTMVGLLYETAGFDPTVVVGATVKEWASNYRVGKSEYFINEADEFFGNFLFYYPDMVVLNNIEFDHPDYFKSYNHVVTTFAKFISNIKGRKILIINQDSKGIVDLLKTVDKKLISRLNLIGYTLDREPLIPLKNSFRAKVVSKSKNGTKFEILNKATNFKGTFNLKIPGTYNVQNALGVVALGLFENIPADVIKNTLNDYKGLGRRMELIGEVKGVTIYDDYAHHPTAIRETLGGIRQMYPKNRVIAVVEPHSYSRTSKLLDKYTGVFKNADVVFITPIYKARDKQDFGVSEGSIVKVAKHKNIKAAKSFNEIIDRVGVTKRTGDVIIVMGAGKSYELARSILGSLK